MEFHPVSNTFPLIDGDEYQRLVDDIKANGLLQPIYTHEDQIIDGRNRYRACLDAGVEPRYWEWDGKGSLVSFVVSLNLHRRHLTPSQCAAVGVEMLPRLEEEARERMLRGKADPTTNSSEGEARSQAGKIVGVGSTIISEAKAIQEKAPETFEKIRAGDMTVHAAKLSLQKAEAGELSKTIKLPKGKYQTIVIDPPWPMVKIERKTAPNQIGFEYPTMPLQQMLDFPLGDLAHDNCHLYLWTTQKHLPFSFELAERWGFKYQCLMTWVKNVGFTPFSWMYSTEHVLFCRRGNLDLLRKGLRLDFAAKVREHSRKPDEFYELVKQASPGPRIDIFSREEREGFDTWGNEAGKFTSSVYPEESQTMPPADETAA